MVDWPSRQVDAGRIVAAHQPSELLAVPKAVHEASEEQDNSHIFGQRDSYVLL